MTVLFAISSYTACLRTGRPVGIAEPTDNELQMLVHQLGTMRGRIIPAGSAYLFDGDTTLLRRIISADARALPFLVDCLSDTTASEVGLHFGEEYVVRVAAVCYEVLMHTEFFRARLRQNAWPPDFEPYVRYDAAPETWLEAQAAWRRYLGSELAKRATSPSSYN